VSYAASDYKAGAWVYGIGLLMLLSASAVYHIPNWRPRARQWFRRVDRSMIYVLIAASYTPFCLAMADTGVTILLPLVWSLATAGIIMTMIWPGSPRWITITPYILLGYCMVPFLSELSAAVTPFAFVMLIAGGALYTIGALAYASKWPNPAPAIFGYHEVFHLLVVAACTCHYAAVWTTVVVS